MVFGEISQLVKFEGADLNYDNSFSNSSPKYRNKAFFALNLAIFFFFGEILQLDKFEGADLKYDNSFLKF